MKPFKVIVIPASAQTVEDLRETTITHIGDLQQTVGGYVEALRLPTWVRSTGQPEPEVILWANEDGMRSLPVNRLATILVNFYGECAGMGPVRQAFHGDICFSGPEVMPDDPDTEDDYQQDCPDNVILNLQKALA